jgi:hypothetical protein
MVKKISGVSILVPTELIERWRMLPRKYPHRKLWEIGLRKCEKIQARLSKKTEKEIEA